MEYRLCFLEQKASLHNILLAINVSLGFRAVVLITKKRE